LSPPEQIIGEAARDFAQGLGVADAVVTRARKRGGQPAVPSRLLQRIGAFCGEGARDRMTARGDRFLRLARALDERPPAPPLERPAPRPDPAFFPRTLGLAEIETLLRDPYAVFARHVLTLEPLEPVGSSPGAASLGALIHAALARFAASFPTDLPSDPDDHLLQIGLDLFGPLAESRPDLHAEWWPRFERLAGAFLRWEEERRGGLLRVHPDVSGSWTFPLSDGSAFTLRARADRIEEGRDGSRTIVDFKTGAVPSATEVFSGFAPRLTLQAAMLKHGAFGATGPTEATPDLLYVHASGGRVPLAPKPVKPPRGETRTVADLVAEHERRLREVIERFVFGQAGFPSRPHPRYADDPSPYDHLARVTEWSLASPGGEGAP
jgi:ATP-dependent helicase/nuclease subunit B